MVLERLREGLEGLGEMMVVLTGRWAGFFARLAGGLGSTVTETRDARKRRTRVGAIRKSHQNGVYHEMRRYLSFWARTRAESCR